MYVISLLDRLDMGGTMWLLLRDHDTVMSGSHNHEFETPDMGMRKRSVPASDVENFRRSSLYCVLRKKYNKCELEGTSLELVLVAAFARTAMGWSADAQGAKSRQPYAG